MQQIKQAIPNRQIKGKFIHVELVSQLDKFPEYHLLFIPETPPISLAQIAQKTSRTNTLIVTVNTLDKKNTMVNLLQQADGRFTFEINKPNITFEYLKIDKDILLLGGTELDVAELYKESFQELTTLKQELKDQQDALKRSKNQLAQSQKQYKEALEESKKIKTEMKILADELDKKTKLIEAKNISIREKEGELLAIQNELQEISNRLRANTALLGERLSTIKSKEEAISQLTDDINQNLQILKSQKAEIENQQKLLTKQKENLAKQGSQIEKQQWWLVISAAVLSAFILLLTMIVYFNKERRKANLQLIEKNAALSEIQKELLVARDQAQAANEAKSSFLANMSHEIRTPMNAIIGMLHLTQQTKLSEKQLNYVNKIDNAANALLEIINDILDFSKVEAGELKIEKIDFSLSKVLNDISNLTGLKIQQKGLEFVYDISPEIPETIIGDPLRLTQVLINLTNNAMKFTEKGEVKVKIDLVSVSKTDIHLSFQVTDTGIGMTEEVSKRLFKPFSQADSSTTRKFGGTGLGLAICKKLIEEMGGSISVKSQPSQGSSFIFDAHFGRKESKNVLDRVDDLLQFKDKQILLIVQNYSTQKALESILENFKCHFATANSFESALGIIHSAGKIQKSFDCIITDLHFVTLHKSELLKACDSQSAKLAVLTPSTSPDEEEIINSLGQVITIDKPATPSSILDALIQIFDSNYNEAIGNRISRMDENARIKKLGTQLQSLKILVAEDNEINQEVAKEILTQASISAHVASNGAEAVEMVMNNEYDCVLMDIQMPIMDGYEAASKIRKSKSKEELPIIAMTANAMGGDKEKCLAAGMNDYISKPIRIKEFFETLNLWLSGKISAAQVKKSNSLQANSNLSEVSSKLIDINGGIELMGDESLFIDLLNQFKEQQENFLVEAASLLKSKNYAELAKFSHDLKGVSANLFIQPLSDKAAALDHACREENDIEAKKLLDSLSEIFDATFSEISSLSKQTSTS